MRFDNLTTLHFHSANTKERKQIVLLTYQFILANMALEQKRSGCKYLGIDTIVQMLKASKVTLRPDVASSDLTASVAMMLATRYKHADNANGLLTRERLKYTNEKGGSYLYGVDPLIYNSTFGDPTEWIKQHLTKSDCTSYAA